MKPRIFNEEFNSVLMIMSKKTFTRPVYFAFFSVFLQFFTLSQARAADIFADVKFIGDGSVNVRGKFEDGFAPLNERNFYFLLGPDDARGRIWDVRLIDSAGAEVRFRELIPGEYLADRPYSEFEYKLRINTPDEVLSGHKSSSNRDLAVLYFDSLLPAFKKGGSWVSARLRLILPLDWKLFSSDAVSANEINIPDILKGTAVCGRHLRSREFQAGNSAVRLVLAGERDFSDAEVEEMIVGILAYYTRQIGRLTAEKIQVAVVPSGDPARSGRWEAETRGSSVLVVSADMPFRNQSRQRLHEQFRHELFHLWFPAGVDLVGDYSTYYEGLAVYLSLRAGVELRQIRFDDMLTTLSTAIVNLQDDMLRPADRSRIYSLGTLAAFTADLSLLTRSRGSRGLFAEVSRIFKLYETRNTRSNRRDDGEVVFRQAFGFDVSETLSRFRSAIAETGLEFSRGRLRISSKLNGQQKVILRKIGYNS